MMAVRERGSQPAGRYLPPSSTRGFRSTISASDGTGLKDTDTGPTVERECHIKGLEKQGEKNEHQGLGIPLDLAVWFWLISPWGLLRNLISLGFPLIRQLYKAWKVFT